MDYSDWFEELVGISTLVASGREKNPETKVVSRLYNLIKFLEVTQAKDSSGNLIVDKARGDYLTNVKNRGLRHFNRAQELKTEIDNRLKVNPQDSLLPELVRDFHHNCYYCIFFCARHLLILNKMLDTNVHEKIPKNLDDLALKDQTKQDIIDKLNSAYSTLQEKRNKADYIMNGKVVLELSNTQTINDSFQMISNLTTDCGVR